MLNIGGLKDGIVLDHIEAGRSLDIYYHLGLDKLECQVAIINLIDLNVLGYIDHNITVNIIRDNKIVEKKRVELPERITNVIHCKNPRCITSIEQELPHIFYLSDKNKETYRCLYCDEEYSGRRKK